MQGLSYILQAIRKHKFVNILDEPGSADLSAYVDFSAIRHSAEETSGVHPCDSCRLILVYYSFHLEMSAQFLFVPHPAADINISLTFWT